MSIIATCQFCHQTDEITDRDVNLGQPSEMLYDPKTQQYYHPQCRPDQKFFPDRPLTDPATLAYVKGLAQLQKEIDELTGTSKISSPEKKLRYTRLDLDYACDILLPNYHVLRQAGVAMPEIVTIYIPRHMWYNKIDPKRPPNKQCADIVRRAYTDLMDQGRFDYAPDDPDPGF